MSQRLINHSPDLAKLRDEGYDLSIKCGYLVIKGVPYVDASRTVKYGILASELTLAGDKTTTPSSHVVHFAGDYPCNQDGSRIAAIQHQSVRQQLDRDLVIEHSFSSKPPGGYRDYYDKMTTYIAIISSQALAIDPNVTAQTFPVIEDHTESVFAYLDTASSRANINRVSGKLAGSRIAIVGLGGTGSYVLDLVAKTPVSEIHLFDADSFLQHNAFRSPGAASIDDLKKKPSKVAYFAARYSVMHRHIVAHEFHITSFNVAELDGMDFVFLCLDRSDAKRAIIDRLEALGTPLIDVGMGVYLVGDALGGVVRVVTSTDEKRDHVRSNHRIPFTDGIVGNEYSQNIQIADLNALNAALAVIKWKKLRGFYQDLENEYYSAYTIDGNTLTNDDIFAVKNDPAA